MKCVVALGALLVVAVSPLRAQSGVGQSMAEQCAAAPTQARDYCYRVVEAVEVVTPRVGISFSGGNPVPGTASTLGMRLGSLPRLSLGARVSASFVDIDGIESFSDTEEQSFPIPSINLDGSIGIFPGVSLAPTIAGFASVDLLASAGIIPLPEGEGFSGSVTSWSAGLRLGLLRESFTAPGVSLSAMYRGVGGVEYGAPDLGDEDAYFRLDDTRVWSARAAVSKRLLALGLTAGAGYDWYEGGATIRVRDPSSPGNAFELSDDQLESSRLTLFGNASFTMMILQLSGEFGWQAGGDADLSLPSAERLEQGGLYGGLALRIVL